VVLAVAVALAAGVAVAVTVERAVAVEVTVLVARAVARLVAVARVVARAVGRVVATAVTMAVAVTVARAVARAVARVVAIAGIILYLTIVPTTLHVICMCLQNFRILLSRKHQVLTGHMWIKIYQEHGQLGVAFFFPPFDAQPNVSQCLQFEEIAIRQCKHGCKKRRKKKEREKMER
jgi:hypothetical protein